MSGVVWFNIFKYQACKEYRQISRNYNFDPEKHTEIEYNITWVHIFGLPCMAVLSLIGFIIGLIISDDQGIKMDAFKIKVKKK